MPTSATSGEDLIQILDELEELLVTARNMPMSSSALVNRDQALELVEKARRAVPTSVRRAGAVLADADSVLAQGRADSDKILRRAHEEAERLVSAENITRLAVERADEIVAAAEAKATELRQGADQYAERSLAGLYEEVGRIAEQIRSGREVLAARMAEPVTQPAQEAKPQTGQPRRRPGWSVDPASA
ncbi:Uncharacterised protein [Actinomyces bovis]|uniref:ATPase n=1 Tax=Actinomyces bovis TaxID=1658 RepID=A0ABY1VKG6_9ACTO|nr:ATPase [Actinomyces bovis]SPT52586.1 Uncharacterised protein [Actinomyces bovis]VEG54386.1 Uncharacterised protein [Actinomyces israelii]